MDDEETVRGREPKTQFVKAWEVKHWFGWSDYQMWEHVKRGSIIKVNIFGKYAKYETEQLKKAFYDDDLGI